jgi:AhpD family alkylhydroperoxidase
MAANPQVRASAEWGECLLPPIPVSTAVATEVRKRLGASPGWLTRLGRAPWLVRAMSTFGTMPVVFAKADLCELVALIVSQDNSCRYCYGVQRSLLRISGYPEESIARLEGDFQSAELSPSGRTALEFTRVLSRANPRATGTDFTDMAQAGFEKAAILEIAAVASAGAFMNRVATLLSLPPEADLEALPKMTIFRFLRPLIARKLRRSPASPEPSPRPNDGPFARLVDTLGNSPFAGIYRRLIDDLFASPALPVRTKALLVAVVAKALGCAYSEGEARRILQAEGFRERDVDELLATLASPRLDARENRLVSFARETVRYQPAAIQLRMREVAAGSEPDEIVEMVATTALANAVGRMSVILDVD